MKPSKHTTLFFRAGRPRVLAIHSTRFAAEHPLGFPSKFQTTQNKFFRGNPRRFRRSLPTCTLTRTYSFVAQVTEWRGLGLRDRLGEAHHLDIGGDSISIQVLTLFGNIYPTPYMGVLPPPLSPSEHTDIPENFVLARSPTDNTTRIFNRVPVRVVSQYREARLATRALTRVAMSRS